MAVAVMMRLDKMLAQMGVGSRSEVKVYIKKGLVKVNDRVVRSADTKVNELSDTVTYRDEAVSFTKAVYYMLNKPAGVVSATEDPRDKTVIDLIDAKKRKDLFPVGRLDKDTEGLLLITSDGALAHQLLSPKKHVPKVYFARVAGQVDDRDVQAFEKGLEIDKDFTALPAKLKILSADTRDGLTVSETEIEIYEGKFHQVKRMFEAVGKKVIYLKRLSMGPLKLDETLAPGQYRPLSASEIDLLGKMTIENKEKKIENKEKKIENKEKKIKNI